MPAAAPAAHRAGTDTQRRARIVVDAEHFHISSLTQRVDNALRDAPKGGRYPSPMEGTDRALQHRTRERGILYVLATPADMVRA